MTTDIDDARPRDTSEIESFVAQVQRAQRAEDVDGFVGLFAPNAVWTTAHGTRFVGRDAIAAFTRKALPGAMRDLQGTTYVVTHVEFLRPDVAAVQVRQEYADNHGVRIDDAAEGAPLYVLVKDDGRWLLAAGQNTPVVTA